MKAFDVVIVGGGTGGICTAARLKRAAPKLNICLIEPSGNHFYQSMFTFVGSGLMPPTLVSRPTSDLVPAGCTWIRDTVSLIEAEQSQISLSGGEKLNYRVLVLAPGLALDIDSISNLGEALNDRRHPVCSIFDSANLEKCANLISQFMGGTMVFSMPSGPIKCPSAPLKILNLADDILRRSGVREVSRVIFITPYSNLFVVNGYAQALAEVAKKRGTEILFEHEVSKIDIRNQELHVSARTEAAAQRNIKTIKYDFAHITPQMKSPQFVTASNLHFPEGPFKNWLKVNPQTLQHADFINIFGVGDVAGVPSLKTGAAARAQAEVVAENILSLFKKGAQTPLPREYNGYTSCPFVTGIGEVMLGEFGYGGKLMPTFPGNPFVPRKSLWFYNTKIMPHLYWNFVLKGII